ncbi:hypothetical protein [Chryseobacterium sp. JM1]|uniref:hypothetical protein n=1 Tax=Chryseobacterium sp. JM1 TaxID=1233950 RepID=UPI0004E79973|nr:hypothetical protein [Chryseobacterium sp. JM1]KFF17783.1 hypothetical protein IW22_19385 [Chryseobacterium sp. JM1]
MGKRTGKYGREKMSQLSKYAQIQKCLNDNKDRRWLTKWAPSVASIWLILVISILCLNNKYLCLSDEVLVRLLETTTLNILGLSVIVLKSYFLPAKKNNLPEDYD